MSTRTIVFVLVASFAVPLVFGSALARLARAAAADEAVPTAVSPPERRSIAILAYPGVELLDFAGPAEVFAVAAGMTRAYEVHVVGLTKEPIVSQGLVTITPTHSIAELPDPDIVVVPGGGVRSVLSSPEAMAWLERAVTNADVVTSVCNGALALARIGALDGLEATTHHGSFASLRESTENTVVHEDARFVDNGRIVTAAGISAGIDMALYLIAREDGEGTARSIARYMEYPFPSIDDVPGKRPGRAAVAGVSSEGASGAAADGATCAARDPEPSPYALGGFDPVALVCGEELRGSADHLVTDGAYTYCFASAANRAAFLAEPGRYRIEHRGTCAGMRGSSGPGTGDDRCFTVHGGRIYIFASGRCRADFESDPDDFVAALERARLAASRTDG